MYKDKFAKFLGLNLNNSPELDYDKYGKLLTSEKASILTRGDENCIVENPSDPNWMSSTW